MLKQKTFLISPEIIGFRVTCTAKVTLVSIKPEPADRSRLGDWKIWVKRPRQEPQSLLVSDFYRHQDNKEAMLFLNLRLLCAPYSKVIFEGMGQGDRLHLKVDFECGKQVPYGEVYLPITAEDKFAKI